MSEKPPLYTPFKYPDTIRVLAGLAEEKDFTLDYTPVLHKIDTTISQIEKENNLSIDNVFSDILRPIRGPPDETKDAYYDSLIHQLTERIEESVRQHLGTSRTHANLYHSRLKCLLERFTLHTWLVRILVVCF